MADGLDGWSPVLAVVAVGERRVHQVVDWIGGQGEMPEVGFYLGQNGATLNADEATDLRGAPGRAGNAVGGGPITAIQLLTRDAIGLGISDAPTFSGLTLSNLTPGSVLFAGALKQITCDPDSLFWDTTQHNLYISGDFDAEVVGVTLSNTNGGTHAASLYGLGNGADYGYLIFTGANNTDYVVGSALQSALIIEAPNTLALTTDNASSPILFAPGFSEVARITDGGLGITTAGSAAALYADGTTAGAIENYVSNLSNDPASYVAWVLFRKSDYSDALGMYMAAADAGFYTSGVSAKPITFSTNSVERGSFTSEGLDLALVASVAPTTNGHLRVQATSNNSLTFKYRGSDGTTRSGSIALS